MFSTQKIINRIEHAFSLQNNQTTIRQEFIAGLTTFLAMVYIIFVNPAILSKSGMPEGAVFTATCLITIFACLLSGFFANAPIAIAPSMGLNAYFTYFIVLQLGFSWQHALMAVLISGVIFSLLTVLKVRQWIVRSIPPAISLATAAGIGLFIGIIALMNAHIVVASQSTLVQLGDFHSFPVLSSLLGLVLIAALEYYKVPGAIIFTVLLISLISLITGHSQFYGVFSMPPSLSSTFLKFSYDHLWDPQNLSIIFTFVIVALFDSTGTLAGLFRELGSFNTTKAQKQIGRALVSDSLSTVLGAGLGTSTTAAYIESAAGIRAGGRTGLTVVFVAGFFILALFFAPLAHMVPLFATTPALLYVACLMLKHMIDIEWHDVTIAIPAAITMIMIPLGFSIANGIGLGILSYVLIKLCCRQWKDINLMLIIISMLYVIFFAVGAA